MHRTAGAYLRLGATNLYGIDGMGFVTIANSGRISEDVLRVTPVRLDLEESLLDRRLEDPSSPLSTTAARDDLGPPRLDPATKTARCEFIRPDGFGRDAPGDSGPTSPERLEPAQPDAEPARPGRSVPLSREQSATPPRAADLSATYIRCGPASTGCIASHARMVIVSGTSIASGIRESDARQLCLSLFAPTYARAK